MRREECWRSCRAGAMIDLAWEVQREVVSILGKYLGAMTVYLVGSRARGRTKPYADIDLLVMNDDPLTPQTRALLRYAFEESNIPFKVDIIENATITESFRKRLHRDCKAIEITANNK